MLSRAFKKFFRLEAAGGICLFISALMALILANIPGSTELYGSILSASIHISFSAFRLEKSVLHLVNDGLMVVFFLLISLEIKREFLEGEISSWGQASLPAIAALGGLLVPAIIYSALTWDDEIALQGWAVSSATDIAFALGVLSLIGSRIPSAIRVFLMTLAVLDDLASILIIALFYTSDLSFEMLLLAICGVLGLLLLNRSRCSRLWPYLLLGSCMWFLILKSGVHATLAGVVLGLTIPLKIIKADETHVHLLSKLEHALHPWVAFVILPIFAFANAGLDLSGFSAADVFSPVTLGIVAGLLIGKPLGISLACYCVFAFGVAKRPSKIPFRAYVGVGFLGGIGFTMSLFIGSLAFEHVSDYYMNLSRLGILCGSFLSGIVGYVALNNFSNLKHPA